MSEEDLKIYYTEHFPDLARQKIHKLEKLRGQDPNGEIEAAVHDYIGIAPFEPSALDQYIQDRSRFIEHINDPWTVEIKDQEVDASFVVSIAMLGILRIHHDTVYQHIVPGMDSKGREVIDLTRSVMTEVQPSNVPQITIEGNKISWLAELRRDIGRTLKRIGQKDEARQEFEIALTELEENKENWTFADQSIFGLVLYELGAMDNDLTKLTAALKNERAVADLQFNRGRLMYLVKKTAAATLNHEYKGTIKDRIQAVSQVIQGYIRAW